LTSIDLQTTVMKLLTLDNNHKCLNYILKIIYSWSLQKYQNNGEEYYPKFFGDMDMLSRYLNFDFYTFKVRAS